MARSQACPYVSQIVVAHLRHAMAYAICSAHLRFMSSLNQSTNNELIQIWWQL
jgi:hypothetical protein